MALLALGRGLGSFSDSEPRSKRGLHVTPLMFEKDGGEVPLLGPVWKPDGTAIAFAALQPGDAPGAYVLRIVVLNSLFV
jgi:hypothetical protein